MKQRKRDLIKTPRLKRIFDIIFSCFLVIITFPLFVLILFLLLIEQVIRLNIPMLIYVEKRISQGKPFNFIKINIFKPRVVRKYRKNGEHIFTKKLEHENGTTTFVGHLVQKAYMDELPQLFTVLFGKMSFVGPRPRDVKQYERSLADKTNTCGIIKAGLTGRYQSHKGEKGANQYKLDIQYINFIKTHSSWQILLNDIKIIMRTIVILLRAQGY